MTLIRLTFLHSHQNNSKQTKEKKYTNQLRCLGTRRIIHRVPVSVVKPERIGFHRVVVLVPVPAVVGMGSVLDVEYRVPEARFPISRVFRLWLRHAAAREFHSMSLTSDNLPLQWQKKTGGSNFLTWWLSLRGSLHRQW